MDATRFEVVLLVPVASVRTWARVKRRSYKRGHGFSLFSRPSSDVVSRRRSGRALARKESRGWQGPGSRSKIVNSTCLPLKI